MAVLSINSHVTFGRVGNAVSVFALERLGIDVWAVHTTLLSHHPGHGPPRGGPVDPEGVRSQIEGLAETGVLGRCAAVLSGYLGTAGTAAVVADAVGRARAANPDALYFCDPVLGDAETGRYVEDATAEAIGESLVRIADVVTPNAYELGLLAGRTIRSLDDACRAAAQLRGAGPGVVVTTSIPDGPDGIANAVTTGAGTWATRTPRRALSRRPDGAGDLFAALLLGRYLGSKDWPTALGAATASVYGLIGNVTAETPVLPTVERQDELITPRLDFFAERLD